MNRCPLSTRGHKILNDRNLRQSVVGHFGSFQKGPNTYDITYPTKQGIRGLPFPLPVSGRVLTVEEARRLGAGEEGAVPTGPLDEPGKQGERGGQGAVLVQTKLWPFPLAMVLPDGAETSVTGAVEGHLSSPLQVRRRGRRTSARQSSAKGGGKPANTPKGKGSVGSLGLGPLASPQAEGSRPLPPHDVTRTRPETWAPFLRGRDLAAVEGFRGSFSASQSRFGKGVVCSGGPPGGPPSGDWWDSLAMDLNEEVNEDD